MRTKEKYALKIQKIQLSAFFHTVSLFKKYLKHENIVKFYASNKDKTYEYLLFEYLPITLFAHLKECKETVGNFMLIMKQMLDVLNFLQNQKIIFMDFKFDNVMLEDDLKVKVIDFGMAVVTSEDTDYSHLRKIDLKKNPEAAYLAPERRNREKFGCNSDVYSFGYCSKMYMNNILSQNDSFSRDGNDFFKKCLEDDPEKRITADLALLHPFFNVIYNFIFCFSNFENFEALKDGKKIRIKDKILYFEHPEYSFVLHCCCSKNKKEFTKLKEVPNEIFSQQESSKQLPQKILYYRAIIGNDVLPIQHLTFSYYNQLKDVFLILKKERRRKLIILSSIVLVISLLVIGAFAFVYYLRKKKHRN
ncbi:protein kinase [Hamiltosporidium magnivora]|uniref:non-specific serine/threonine protein kinase n=1 Tax=Hamiltosporidium magnivora TaxID=148818 RepID=A0A4Q9LG19_9MICR|nr:protein kinase [Hamiltosporidium magnivora]